MFISAIFELVFAFWDPFGYNNLKPSNYADLVSEVGERAFRAAIQQTTQTYRFQNLVSSVLTNEEILESSLKSYVDIAHYLNALTVISRGQVINKGKLVTFDGTYLPQFTVAAIKSNAKQFRLTPESFSKYNETFLKKTKTHNIFSFIFVICIIVGACFLLTNTFLCVTFIVAGISFGLLARNELKNNTMLNILTEFKIRI